MNQSFREAWGLLPDYLGQHVILSVSALILGVAISVPLGIIAARNKTVGAPVLGLVSVIRCCLRFPRSRRICLASRSGLWVFCPRCWRSRSMRCCRSCAIW